MRRREKRRVGPRRRGERKKEKVPRKRLKINGKPSGEEEKKFNGKTERVGEDESEYPRVHGRFQKYIS